MYSLNSPCEIIHCFNVKAREADRWAQQLVFAEGIGLRRQILDILGKALDISSKLSTGRRPDNGNPTQLVVEESVAHELLSLGNELNAVWTELAEIAVEDDQAAEEYWRSADVRAEKIAAGREEVNEMIQKLGNDYAKLARPDNQSVDDLCRCPDHE